MRKEWYIILVGDIGHCFAFDATEGDVMIAISAVIRSHVVKEIIFLHHEPGPAAILAIAFSRASESF